MSLEPGDRVIALQEVGEGFFAPVAKGMKGTVTDRSSWNGALTVTFDNGSRVEDLQEGRHVAKA
jgi:hypothetical protein